MESPFRLDGKNILITGASSGIGKQCAIECSKEGANIILIGRNTERLKQTMDEMEGKTHLFYSLDITDFENIEPMVSDAVNQLGKIHGFIHSAGIETTLPLKVLKPVNYQELFNVNVIAGFEFARIITKKKYINETGASLLFIASITGIIGRVGLIAYSATKGALISAVKSMALELASKNIRVNSISPGTVMTEMMKKYLETLNDEQRNKRLDNIPLGIGAPKDVAHGCIYLLSDAAKWVTGTNLIVDGGYCAK